MKSLSELHRNNNYVNDITNACDYYNWWSISQLCNGLLCQNCQLYDSWHYILFNFTDSLCLNAFGILNVNGDEILHLLFLYICFWLILQFSSWIPLCMIILPTLWKLVISNTSEWTNKFHVILNVRSFALMPHFLDTGLWHEFVISFFIHSLSIVFLYWFKNCAGEL